MVFRKLLTAQPAPLIVAASARNMIALSFLTFRPSFALGAFRKVVVVGRVIIEFSLIVIVLLARSIRVPGLTALEAHLIAALTDTWLIFLLCLLYVT